MRVCDFDLIENLFLLDLSRLQLTDFEARDSYECQEFVKFRNKRDHSVQFFLSIKCVAQQTLSILPLPQIQQQEINTHLRRYHS